MDDRARYDRAVHCIQAGSKMVAARNGEHPQSRTGINIAMRDHASLVQLLIGKGVITEAEYLKAMADGAEDEVRGLEEQLGSGGTKVTLVGRLGGIHDDERTS
jgi:hypothetical protein